MDEITIYERGLPAGTLRRRREGLYTVFEARLPPSGELTRLTVCGGGARCCLGVMEPRGDGRFLLRRYSRAALRRLPAVIEYAAADGTRPAPPPSARREAPPPSPPVARLVTLAGTRYLALPCALRRKVPGLRLATLAGAEYLLFRC